MIHRDLELSSVRLIHRDLVLSSVRFIHRDLELSSVRFSHRDLVLRNEAGPSVPTNKKLSPMLKGTEIGPIGHYLEVLMLDVSCRRVGI